MAVAIAVTPASGSIEAKKSFVRVDLTGGDPAVRSYLQATKAGEATLKSHVFEPSPDGLHTWDNLMFPASGTWAISLRDASDDSIQGSAQNVTVT